MSTIVDTTIIHENARCNFCFQIKKFTQEIEVYYNAGRNKRIVYLCFSFIQQNNNADSSCCYFNYIKDLGLGLVVSEWYKQVYDTILSVFISSPLHLTSSSIANKNGRETEEQGAAVLAGGGNIKFENAIRVAYNLSPIVRQYLNAVDKKKVPDVLNIEANPRLWPIRFRLMYQEPRVIKVCDEPLTF